MSGPKKFKMVGKAFLGYAVGVKLSSGAEVIMFCPTALEAEVAAETFCPSLALDPKEIKRAVLGPRSLVKPVAATKEQGNG